MDVSLAVQDKSFGTNMISAAFNCDTSADNVDSQFVCVSSLSQLNGMFKRREVLYRALLTTCSKPIYRQPAETNFNDDNLRTSLKVVSALRHYVLHCRKVDESMRQIPLSWTADLLAAVPKYGRVQA